MIEDFIRIRGDSTDPAPFQGIGGTSSTVGTDTGTDTGTIPDAVWLAQNTILTAQSSYATQLAEELGSETSQSGMWKFFSSIANSFAEEILQQVIGEFIEHTLHIPDDFAEIIAALIIGIIQGILQGIEDLSIGNAQCEAIISENTALLAMLNSVDAYHIRNTVIQRHDDTIRGLVGTLQESQSRLVDWVNMVISFFSNSGDTEEEDETGWDTVISTITSETAKVETWLNDMETKDASDLPIPAPPTLPAPPSGATGTKLKIAYQIARFAFKLYTEIMKKQRETDTHLTDLVEAVDALRFNGQRIHLESGDIIEFTGIGTIGENFNT